MNEELIAKITSEIEARKVELLELLTELVSFPTVSPPARNTNNVQEFIKGYLEELGFTTDKWDVYPGDPNVVGILPGSSSNKFKSLIVNGHVDVAEVGADVMTGPLSVMTALLNHPLTDIGLAKFLDDHRKASLPK